MEKKITLLQVLSKSQDGSYRAVLSDTSIDRDDEIVSEKALQESCMTKGQTPILLDHDNSIEKRIGHWINKRMEKINGHSAFVAEPVFYKSNPKAMMIKGMLDEGAELGISIGAIVKETGETTIENKSYTTYDKIELLEASFVGVPSNRHGMAMAVAKMFGGKNKMADEMIKKVEFDNLQKAHEELKKQFEEEKAELEKSVNEKESKIEELEKSLEESKTALEESEKACGSAKEDKENEEEEKKKALEEVKSVKAELEKLKNSPVFKADFGKVNEDEELDKSYKSGALPIYM